MIGVFGGTFNPIHFGHLRPALEVLEALQLTEMRIIPCAIPPHRQEPEVSAPLRMQMVEAAIAQQPKFVVDDRELKRGGSSYSVDTLASLRREVGQESIVLVVGMDAFLSIHTWHRWRELFELAHIAIMHRPGQPSLQAHNDDLDEAVSAFLTHGLVADSKALQQRKAGNIIVLEVSQLDISATAIRNMVNAGRSPRFLTADAVLHIIEKNKLYC